MSLLLRDLLLEYEFEVLEKLGHQIRPQIRDLNYGRRHPPPTRLELLCVGSTKLLD